MKHATFIAFLLFAFDCFAQDDVGKITRLLSETFDKPQAKVVSQPVVVEGNFAVADWMQGGHGGRALLARQKNHWKIISCGGAALSQKDTMISAGIPEDQAITLEQKLSAAESSLDPHQIHLFNVFNGEPSHH